MLFNKLELYLSWKFVRGKRKETFISVVSWFSFLGIMLGVATLIVVMSVMNGFRIELLSKLLGIYPHVSINTKNIEAVIDEDALQSTINSFDQVEFSAAVLEQQALVSFNGKSSGVLVRGIKPKDFARYKIFTANLQPAAALEGFSVEKFPVIIGINLAKKLEASIGDKITMIAPEGTKSPFGIVPKYRDFVVVGTVNSGYYDADSNYIFMPRLSAKNFFTLQNEWDYFDIRLNNPNDTREVAKSLHEILPPEILVYDWQSNRDERFQALQVERNVMFIILTLIIVVASFNIISGQIMLVRDKEQNIALLRGMGASKSMILKVFFLTGISISILGSIIGSILGVLLAVNLQYIRTILETLFKTTLFPQEIYYLADLPSKLIPFDIVLTISIALFLSFIAAMYPAWRASKLDPVEILRNS